MEIDYWVLGLALFAVLAVAAGLVWQNQGRTTAANRQNAELARAQQQLAGQLNAIAANSAAAQEAIGKHRFRALRRGPPLRSRRA